MKKLYLLLLLISFTTSCEQDKLSEEDIIVEEELKDDNIPVLTMKRIEYDEIVSNPEIGKKFSKMSNTKQELNERLLTFENYDITILVDSSTYIQKGEYNSYTFATLQNENGLLQNVLFNKNKKGKYDAFLLTYPYNKLQKDSLNPEDLPSQVAIEKLEIDFEDLNRKQVEIFYVCTYTYEYTPDEGQLVGVGNDDLAGWYLTVADCETVLAPVYESYSPGYGFSSDGQQMIYGGGGSISTSPTGSIYSYQVLMKLDRVKDELDAKLNEKTWIDTAVLMSLSIYDFLKQNAFSNSAKTFARKAMETWMDAGSNAYEDQVNFEERIILDSSFQNHQRLKCVYEKFKTGTNTISNYLNSFLPDNAVGHLNFSADSNFKANQPQENWGAGAVTEPPVNGVNGSVVSGYNINIIFNTDPTLISSAQNFPTLILAQELIHEMVHAEMYRKLLECAQLPHVNYNNYTNEQWTDFIYSLRHNYEGLHDYFLRYKFYKENGQLIPIEGPTEEQHQQMASHYRDMMVAALKDFDNNQHSDEFYHAIAWIGLKGTEAWNDPTVNQIEINQIINDAITNETHNCNN